MVRVTAAIRRILSPRTFMVLMVVVLCFTAVPSRQYIGFQLLSVHQFDTPVEQRGLPAPPPTRKNPVVLIPQPPDCSQLKCIALTFDDGPNPDTTSSILSTLSREHVRATFFVVGSNIAGHEDLLRQMNAGGHEIGNHSWDHPNMTTLTPEQIIQEISATQAAITAAGVPAPRLFRPPYGAVNDAVRQNAGLEIALWNVDPRDWDHKTPEEVQQILVASAHPGCVIDAHDIYGSTAAAIGPAIDTLKAQNYTFVTMSELMHGDTETPGQVFYGLKAH